jgi:hypothetical protein
VWAYVCLCLVWVLVCGCFLLFRVGVLVRVLVRVVVEVDALLLFSHFRRFVWVGFAHDAASQWN